jgi:hypothetical protein
MIGKGSPEGKVKGSLGDLYLDSTCALVFEKRSNGGCRNWVTIGQLLHLTVDTGLQQPNRPRPYGESLPMPAF